MKTGVARRSCPPTGAAAVRKISTNDDAVPTPKSVLVYAHSWLPAQVDGVAVRMMAHVKALVERGVKVTVVTPDFILEGEQTASEKNDPPPKLANMPGIVEHVTLRTQRIPVYRKVLCMELSVRNLQRLVSVIRRTRPDIVHGTQEASMQVLATACLICNVPLVISMHTDVTGIASADKEFSSLGGQIGRMHARISVAFTNLGYRNWAVSGASFFPVSRQARAMLDDAYVSRKQVNPENWGPMVDREIFRIDQPEDQIAETRQRLTFGIADAFLLVYAGRVTAEKDVQFLVDALDRAPQNVVLALVGSGSAASELSKLHGSEHRLYCTGDFVSREEVALAFRAADCCVSASTMETIGLTAMEALSCGTPMLTADAQGFAEHLTNGVNARLWTPNDAESFDRELGTILATQREGCWSPVALRESMESASLVDCTDRALRTYQFAQRANYRAIRLPLTFFTFLFNYLLTFFIK